MKNSKGFTLIELLAVILILGVIALIAIPSVNNVIRQSRMGANKTTAQEMIKAARQYYTTCQINGGKTLNGTVCYSDFKAEAVGLDSSTTLDPTTGEAALDTAKLKAELELSGEIPAYGDISVFKIQATTGDWYLSFEKDGFVCKNFSDATVTASTAINDEVTCDEKTE